MKTMYGNLWNFHSLGPVCITTNGIIKKDGELVMGAGIALQAKNRFPELPRKLAELVGKYGNRVFYLSTVRVFSFPTKDHWRDKSELGLIEQSSKQLVEICDRTGINQVYLPKPGCANGGLSWDDVNQLISQILDDRFTVTMLT